MTHSTLLTAAVSALALAAPLSAQTQVSAELRGSLQRPVGDFSDAADGDAGFGGDVFVSVNPRLSLYGGYSLENFGCDGCGDDDSFRSKGFEAGAKVLFGRRGAVLPWVRAGATLHQLEVERGALEATSDRKVGFQASVGVDIPLGEVLSFSPALRYQAYQAEFDVIDDALVAQQDVGFLALDFGLHIHPGG